MSGEISEIVIVIIIGTTVVLFLLLLLSVFVYLFKRRQLQFRLEKDTLKSNYDQEILKSQLEIQNLTLQQIGEELHDNIGQLLSVAKINLNILEANQSLENSKEYIVHTNEIIGQTIHDLRALTKSLDGDFVDQFGLLESITFELQRVRKTKQFLTDIQVIGVPYILGYEKEIVLFRIFQEFLNNSIKYSQAKNINIRIEFSKDNCLLLFTDDGKGFDLKKIENNTLLKSSGSGLRNIARRCKLIGAQCELKSWEQQGTELMIIIATKNITKLDPSSNR